MKNPSEAAFTERGESYTKQILFIEDNPAIRRVLLLFLNSRGYEVITAQNGIEGIEFLSEENCFSLVITDIRMPGATGNQVAKYIKDKKHTAKIPIIAITAYPQDAEKGLFDCIVEKPFSFKDLLHLVESLFL